MPIYKDIYNGPPRGYTATKTKKRYIAIHNTSNDAPARNEASYAKNRTDSVSSHYYVDGKDLIQSLNTDYKAWHAGSGTGNSYAISYEIVGTNSKSRDWWLKNVNWDKLAKQIATDMKEFGIKNQHLTIAQMRDGKSTGIVTHDDMRRAWGGTTHTDPGSNFPMDHLIAKVNQYLNGEDEDMDYATFLTYYKKAIADDAVEARDRAISWQYAGGGIEAGKSALNVFNDIHEAVKELKKDVDALKVTEVTGPVNVTVSDEQLERVLRKVLGSVDGVEIK